MIHGGNVIGFSIGQSHVMPISLDMNTELMLPLIPVRIPQPWQLVYPSIHRRYPVPQNLYPISGSPPCQRDLDLLVSTSIADGSTLD